MRRALVATAALLAAALPSSALAAAAPGLSLSVAPRPHHAGELRLVSRLEGSGKGGTSVSFFVVSTEFGKPLEVPIGAARTKADGTASVDYAPTWSGRETFVARLAGPGEHPPQATASYRVATSTAGPLAAGANPGRPLASVGGPFLDVILTLVGLVWLSLAAVLAAAFGWLPRLAGRGAD